jgi:hypothetical protein
MAERTERSVLNHLIATCRDVERGPLSAAGATTAGGTLPPHVREIVLDT